MCHFNIFNSFETCQGRRDFFLLSQENLGSIYVPVELAGKSRTLEHVIATCVFYLKKVKLFTWRYEIIIHT